MGVIDKSVFFLPKAKDYSLFGLAHLYSLLICRMKWDVNVLLHIKKWDMLSFIAIVFGTKEIDNIIIDSDLYQ